MRRRRKLTGAWSDLGKLLSLLSLDIGIRPHDVRFSGNCKSTGMKILKLVYVEWSRWGEVETVDTQRESSRSAPSHLLFSFWLIVGVWWQIGNFLNGNIGSTSV